MIPSWSSTGADELPRNVEALYEQFVEWTNADYLPPIIAAAEASPTAAQVRVAAGYNVARRRARRRLDRHAETNGDLR